MLWRLLVQRISDKAAGVRVRVRVRANPNPIEP